jgi:hypothetical protein
MPSFARSIDETEKTDAMARPQWRRMPAPAVPDLPAYIRVQTLEFRGKTATLCHSPVLFSHLFGAEMRSATPDGIM